MSERSGRQVERGSKRRVQQPHNEVDFMAMTDRLDEQEEKTALNPTLTREIVAVELKKSATFTTTLCWL